MRKLATWAFAFSAAIFAANYILPTSWLPVCVLVFALAAAALLVLRRKWLRAPILFLLGAAMGLGCFYLHGLRTTLPAKELDGETREITARVLEYPDVYENYCRVRVKLEGEDLPKLKAFVYDSNMWIAGAEPGQKIHFTGRFSSADIKYGKKYDVYNAQDLYLTIRAKSAVRMTDHGLDLRTLPARVRHAVSQNVLRVFPSDVSAFIKALMLGDKTELYRDTGLQYALSHAGFMHVVAVSGMHIAFLVGLLQLLMGNTRRGSLLCILLIWMFVLLTGASPSAVRAGIMQTLLLLAPIVKRENDPPTALFTALALILIGNPRAAASVSLQLSFASMAGILWLAEPIRNALLEALPERAASILEKPVDGIAVSVAAMVFTVPLVALHFGYVTILSPITNILALWAVSLCFCGAYVSCLLAFILPAAGSACAWLTAWFARYIILVVRGIASISFSSIFLQSGWMLLWLVLSYGAFLLAGLSRLRRKWKILLPLVLTVIGLFAACRLVEGSYEKRPGMITVLDVGQGQCITAFAGDKTVMIDCGGLMSIENAGETAGAYLLGCGRKEIDTLLITHPHEDHANGVCTLLEMLPVKRIFMPTPTEKSALLNAISDCAVKHGTEIFFLAKDMQISDGDLHATLYAPETDGDENERSMITKLSIGRYDMLVTGDAGAEGERKLLQTHEIRDIELLIVGHHGSKTASSEELLSGIGAKTAVISVGYNSYGNPEKEVLERLAICGYTVYRTDQSGNVVVRIGQEYG